MRIRKLFNIALVCLIVVGDGILIDRISLPVTAAPIAAASTDNDWGSCPAATGDDMLGILTYIPEFAKLPHGNRQFTMVIISDTQYHGGCQSECRKWLSAHGHTVDIENMSPLSNEWHRNSILELPKRSGRNFAGIILNGDVTAFSWGLHGRP